MFGWFKCRKDTELYAKLDRMAKDENAHYRNLKGMIMASKEQFEAAFARVDTATSGIAKVIRDLIAKIQGGGMTAEEEAAILAKLDQSATALEGMAVDPTNPVPTEPPTV